MADVRSCIEATGWVPATPPADVREESLNVMDDLDRHVDEYRGRYIALLQQFCRQPSISAQGIGMGEAVQMLSGMFEEVGARVRVLPSGGYPVVYAEAGDAGRVLSFYNHYDVQPPEPLDHWESPPFEAEIRDGRIYARGVADNKGNLVARICAIDAFQRVRGRLPLQVRFIVEGEEEIASLNLETFVDAYPDLIRADANIWESGTQDVYGRPILSLGLKGLCYVELRTRSMARDLHSSLGASVPNAAWRLTWALATLKGPDGRIRIPGFYDRVVPPSERDLEMLARLPDIEAERMGLYGIDQFTYGHTGMDLRINEYFQPTGTICGLDSGYSGPGIKTVMPAIARAKVDFRLVIDQDPEEIFALLRAHLDQHGFGDVEAELFGAERPARTAIDSPIVQIVSDSYRELSGQEPVVVPTSLGSGPMHLLTQKFRIPSCTSGAGHAGSHVHAPNENIFVEDYLREIKHIARVIDRFAAW